MKMMKAKQKEPIADDIRARYSLVAPCLEACLNTLPGEWIERLGGLDKVRLFELADVHTAHEGDGDTGICFEYAVHEAIASKHPLVWPLVSEVLEDGCGIKGGAESILFGPEKEGKIPVLKTAEQALTKDSRVLVGNVGQPAKLKKHIKMLGDVHRGTVKETKLPASIRGIWKADLFLGNPDPDRWVGVTVKSTSGSLKYAQGLRIGIYPAGNGKDDKPRVDEDLNLIRLPLPYDEGFSELFMASWAITRALLRNKAREPKGEKALDLVYGPDKYVAQQLEARREASVQEVLAWLRRDSQKSLLEEAKVVDVPVQATMVAAAKAKDDSIATADLFPAADTTTLSPLPVIGKE